MNGLPSPGGWRQRVLSAVVLLLVIAIGARIIADLVAPLIPALVVIAVLCTLLRFIIGKRR